ncbi:MAG: helix-turn-helix transcriptional regulator, partial [Planctomycetes bacterium]|nr:helix-turn-helix transcriptional regulator [Planctomycetota bacterium]
GIYFKHPAHKKILSLAQRISALAYLAGRQYCMADALLAEILMHMHGEESQSKKQQLTFEHILMYLENNVNAHFDRDRMAAYFSVHPLTLDRLCKVHNKQTARHIHQQMRMDVAQSLLQDHRNTVAAVALQIGFEDPFHFSRVFKKVQGLSPKRFQLL